MEREGREERSEEDRERGDGERGDRERQRGRAAGVKCWRKNGTGRLEVE